MKHVRVNSGEGLFSPQDLWGRKKNRPVYAFPYSGESRNNSSYTPQKELCTASMGKTRSKSLARENVACLSQCIFYFFSTSSNTSGKTRKDMSRRDTDYHLEWKGEDGLTNGWELDGSFSSLWYPFNIVLSHLVLGVLCAHLFEGTTWNCLLRCGFAYV